jgi:hypothetical protein
MPPRNGVTAASTSNANASGSGYGGLGASSSGTSTLADLLDDTEVSLCLLPSVTARTIRMILAPGHRVRERTSPS